MRLLLCTEFDRTLLPNGDAPESPEARPRFRALAARPEVTLAYVTDLGPEELAEAITDYGIPPPSFVVGDLGAGLYRVADGRWTPSPAWTARLAPDWGRRDRTALAALLAGVRGLTPRETATRAPHRLSYATPPDWDHRCLLPEMDDLLARHRVRANLIWTLEAHAARGRLDVLPASAGRRQAVEVLMQQAGAGRTDTLIAGGSRDALALLASPVPAVLVANADEDVRAAALAAAADEETADSLYLATGGFQGMNGNYAAGILEGIAHFLPAAASWWD